MGFPKQECWSRVSFSTPDIDIKQPPISLAKKPIIDFQVFSGWGPGFQAAVSSVCDQGAAHAGLKA